MSYFMYFLGLCAVFLSLFGYMTFFHERFKISPSFTPVLSVSSLAAVLYILGFSGFLAPSSILIYAVGSCLLVRTAYLCFRGRYSVKGFIFSPGIIAFCIFAVFFILRSRSLTLLHVDNFSHWATAVKDMCLTDAYPKLSGAVTFRNYTPGAAIFIYHVCKAVGFTESHAIMAQGIMISACVSALFCKTCFRRPLGFAAVFGTVSATFAAFSLEGASLGIYNLTVDGLLAYVCTAGGIMAFVYRRELTRCILLLTPLTVWLSLIKSSGKIFSLLLIVFVFVLFFKAYFRKTTLKKKLTLSAVCGGVLSLNLLLPWLWDIYSDVVFKGYQNKFPSGLGVFSAFTSKDPSFLRSVFADIIAEVRDTSSSSSVLLTVSLITGVTVTLLSFIFKGKGKFMFCVCLTSVSVLVFYITELFVLYGFIFPEAEAVILASFYRYFATASILISLVLLTASVYAVERMKFTKGKSNLSGIISSVLVLALAISPLLSVSHDLALICEPYRDEEAADALEKREHFKSFYSAVSEKVPPNSFLIVYTEKTDFFTSTLAQYELRTTHCLYLYQYMLSSEELVTSRINYPEYFIVESGEAVFRTFMESRGFSFVGSSTVYSVDRDTMTLTAK